MRLLREESIDNLSRAKSLVDLFERTSDNSIGSDDERSELLRAAVVFMHSSIEEIVRNLFVSRLPNASKDILNGLAYSAYPSNDRKNGVLLGDLLHNHAGRLVENVIFDAINSHVDRLNINNSDQLVAQLKKVQIDTVPLTHLLEKLNLLMKRRHQIVHQMDREDALDPDTRPISAITSRTVNEWFASVAEFHAEIIRQAEPNG